jgi:hypothetical protein
MWMLKNSKDPLDNFNSCIFSKTSSIQTFDFSTLHTTIPHEKLKTCLKEIIHNVFYVKKNETKDKKCYTENEVIIMLELLIDNKFVEFRGYIFQQIISIPMEHTVPLSLPIFTYTPMRLSLYKNCQSIIQSGYLDSINIPQRT